MSVLVFFMQKYCLITHKVNVHSNKTDRTKKDFQCKFCDKKFLPPKLQVVQDQL